MKCPKCGAEAVTYAIYEDVGRTLRIYKCVCDHMFHTLEETVETEERTSEAEPPQESGV